MLCIKGRLLLMYMTNNMSIMGKFDIKNQIWSIVKDKIKKFFKIQRALRFPGNLIFVKKQRF